MGKMQANHNKQIKTLARSDEASPTVIFFNFPLRFITKSFMKEKRMLRKSLRKYIQTKPKSIEKQVCSVLYVSLNVDKNIVEHSCINRWRSTRHKKVLFQGHHQLYFIGTIYF
jgi:hypothetical protein